MNLLQEILMQRSMLGLALLALSAVTNAETFDYTYVSLGYGTTELDGVDADGDGFGIDGSVAISDNFHLFAGYSNSSFDFDVDANTLAAGIGYNTSLTNVVDFVGRVSYQYVELDAPGLSGVDDNGIGLGVGLRYAASERLELDAGINYVDLSDSGDDTSFGLGGLYSFTDSFALGLSGDWGDDASTYSAVGRFYFGH